MANIARTVGSGLAIVGLAFAISSCAAPGTTSSVNAATSSSASAPSGMSCPDAQIPPQNLTGPDTAFDTVGDACGYPDQPRADIQSLTWSTKGDNTTFSITFAPPPSGSEAAAISLSDSPSQVDDECAYTSLLMGSPGYKPVAVLEGCTSANTLRTVYSGGNLSRDRGQLSATIPTRYLPTSAGAVYLRISAFTALSTNSTTVVSDHLPDEHQPALRV